MCLSDVLDKEAVDKLCMDEGKRISMEHLNDRDEWVSSFVFAYAKLINKYGELHQRYMWALDENNSLRMALEDDDEE